ncbi:MAG TPA: Rid family detoxifying hydrolase [Candidatus Tumulicola sp.]|nr:Rid family detoxifying hydrolase [Candidatus Tumulicola sp.]
MKVISTPSAPQPVAAYSQGIVANGFVYTAGQVGLDVASGLLVDGIEAQAERALTSVKNIIEAAGLSVADIVKVTIFVTDLSKFALVNAVYARFVGDHRPARSTVGVAALPLGAMIEVEAIAAQPSA